eukprot:SAG31_NODE_2069_length_6520_cov_9.531226_8_plen_70_part_00
MWFCKGIIFARNDRKTHTIYWKRSYTHFNLKTGMVSELVSYGSFFQFSAPDLVKYMWFLGKFLIFRAVS